MKYEMLHKISQNLNIPRKPLTLQNCAARCLFLYLSTVSQPTGVFMRARISEFLLFSLHRMFKNIGECGNCCFFPFLVAAI